MEKSEKIRLVEMARKKILERKDNPTAVEIEKEISRISNKDPTIKKLSSHQIHRLAKSGDISLPAHKIDKNLLVSRIKTISSSIKKPTLRNVILELNKVEDFPRWNYQNLWNYLKSHEISSDDIGIIPERKGASSFSEEILIVAKEASADLKTNQFPLKEIRERLNLKPAAFANRVKRGNIDLNTLLLSINIEIEKSQKRKTNPPQIASVNKKESPILISEEIESWFEEFKEIPITEEADFEKHEITQLIFSLIEKSEEKLLALKKFQNILNEKKEQQKKLIKEIRKKKKKLNKNLDLKHYDGSIADKLLDLVLERKKGNIEAVKSDCVSQTNIFSRSGSFAGTKTIFFPISFIFLLIILSSPALGRV